MIVSIITINYNNANGLKDTIGSVIHQSAFNNIQYIVVDGCSTDSSLSILSQYKDSFSYCISEPDNGIFNAMNKGLKHAIGDYVIFMNSGDKFYDENVISQFVKEKRQCDIYIGDTEIYYEDGKKGLWQSPDDVNMHQLLTASVSHQATFYKTPIIKKYGYDENLRIVSDWKLFIQLFMKDDCSYSRLPFTVCIFQWGGISSMGDLNNAERECVLKTFYSQRELNNFHDMLYGSTEYERLLHKIHKYGVSGKILRWFLRTMYYFQQRKKRLCHFFL